MEDTMKMTDTSAPADEVEKLIQQTAQQNDIELEDDLADAATGIEKSETVKERERIENDLESRLAALRNP